MIEMAMGLPVLAAVAVVIHRCTSGRPDRTAASAVSAAIHWWNTAP
jgi:hypothetical protein